MNYKDRDTYGMYADVTGEGAGPDARHGPGPDLMGADTLLGNDVSNKKGVDLGDTHGICQRLLMH